MRLSLKTALLFNRAEPASPAPPAGIVTAVSILNDISISITNPSAMSVPVQTNGSAILVTTSGSELESALNLGGIRLEVEDEGWTTAGARVTRSRTIRPRLKLYTPPNDVIVYQPNPGQFWMKVDDHLYNQDAIWKTTVVQVIFDSDWLPGAAAETFPGASVTRLDTKAYPEPCVRPISYAWDRAGVGETIPMEISVVDEFARDSSMAACVEAYVVDGNGNKGVTARQASFARSVNTPSSGWMPGLPVATFYMDLAMPTTGTPTYRAERRYIVKPWIGPPWCSADETIGGVAYTGKGVAYPTFNPPVGVPFCFDYDNSHTRIYGRIAQDPAGATIASSVNVATVSTAGLCKTEAGAYASGQTYADLATFLTAVRRLNNSAAALTILSDNGLSTTTYQRPTPHTTIYTAAGSIGGAVACFANVGGSTAGADAGCYSIRVSASSQATFPPAYMAAEGRAQNSSTPSDAVRIRGKNFDGSTPSSRSVPSRMIWRGIFFDSSNMAAETTNHEAIDSVGDLSSATELNGVYSVFIDCKGLGTMTVAGGFSIMHRAGWRWFIRTELDGLNGTAVIHPSTGIVTGLVAAIGSKFARTGASATGNNAIPVTALCGCKVENLNLNVPAAASDTTNTPSQVQPKVTHSILFNVEQLYTINVTSDRCISIGSDHPQLGLGICNYLVKHTGASWSGPSMAIGNDGYLREMSGVVIFNFGFASVSLTPSTGDARINIGYNDQGYLRLNKFLKLKYSYFPTYNSKGAAFLAPETPNAKPAWNSTASYYKGAIVTNGGNAYQAKVDIPASSGILLSDTASWHNGGAQATAFGRQPLRGGNDDFQYHVGCVGNVAAKSSSGSAPGPLNGGTAGTNWYGYAWGPTETYETGDSDHNTNWFANRASADFTPKAAGRLVNRIPAGFAPAPFDLYGTPIANDGTGAAGPIQRAA